MKSFSKALIYGVSIWAIAFIAAIIIFPFHESERPLFESIMPVVLTLSTVLFSYLYFSRVDINFIKEGFYLGIIWFIINILIDQLLFSWGPMKMSIVDYFKDIGLTYLLIPAITIGIGFIEEKKFQNIIKGIPK